MSPVIDAPSGVFHGARFRGADSFLGIRYGELTEGRWRRAAPYRYPEPATATAFGDRAPQPDTRADVGAHGAELLALLYPGSGSPLELTTPSEDCLNLNVWTPEDSKAETLPVMVWFHGGAYSHGSANEACFRGDRLAAKERVVVVSVSHRLGALGFLHLEPIFGAGYADAGTVGLHDLVTALEWVRENIAAFGGDAANVTVFGQSGGGSKVASLMAAPSATGLFHKAIIQSGVPGMWLDTDSAEQYARAILAALDASSATPAELDALPLRAILEAQLAVGPELGLAPVLDGRFVDAEPFRSAAPATAAGIPVLVGHARHDMSMMIADEPGYAELSEEELAGRRAELGMPAHDESDSGESPSLRWARLLTDTSFGASAARIAELAAAQSRVHRYEFAYRTDALGGILGAGHSLDLPFVFGTVDHIPYAGTRHDRFTVSEQVMATWARFARSGDPGWPEYTTRARNMRVLDVESSTVVADPPSAPTTPPW